MHRTGSVIRVLASRTGRLFSKKLRRLFTIGSMTAYGLVGFVEPASAAITPTANAIDIANAMSATPGLVTGASFEPMTPPAGTVPNAIADSALAGFPRNGPNYGILTSGDPNLADDPNSSEQSGLDLNGPSLRGDTDFDVTILKVDLNVPATANCLFFEFKFLSEEYPEFVGTQYNDAFIAELDKTTWDTSGATITSPDNLAFDQLGKVISINSTGIASVSPGNAFGTTYDAATPILGARAPVTAGPHSLYLSIFDQSDQIYDAAVFLDGLTVTTEAPGQCTPGAVFDCTITGTPGDDKLTGTPGDDVICGLGGKDRLVGLEGNDRIDGGSGNDFLIPGIGDDLVVGATGEDTVSFEGSPGPVKANLGKGTVTGAQGNDDMTGVENAIGTTKGDTLNGSGAKNELKGKKGADKLAGLKKSDELIGGAGNDRLDGGPGTDTCIQGPGSGPVVNCE